MTQQLIGIGTVANDRTGDPNRVAFDKINDNFADLYAVSSSTVNAGDVRFLSGGTIEGRIQLAINQALAESAPRVFIPANMLPYDASLVTFDLTVQMVREGGDVTLYDVLAYGASNAGIVDAAVAAAKMYAVLPAGATASWPSGTYRMHFGVTGVPLITILQDNVATRFDPGAVLQATGASPTTTAEEKRQYIFMATGKSGLTFQGGKFDGNRTASPDPAAGFFLGMQCSRIKIREMVVQDSSNAYGGVIQAEAWDGATAVMLRDWVISGNNFYRCSWCTNIRNLWYGIEIARNYFEDGDLEAPNTGYPKLGDTAYSRAIRFTGYVNATSADGPIGNAVISNNRINRVAYAIEVWNQDAVNGRNPDNAELISIQNNTILSLWGIGVNSYRDVTISGNSWKRLELDAAALAAYPGYAHVITNTAHFGAGLEARPGYGHAVFGNVVDGQWVSGEAPDLTGSCEGIELGNNAFDVRCEARVTGNVIQRCYTGISCMDLQHSAISDNTIRECRAALLFTAGGTNSYGRSDNTFSGNTVQQLAAQAATNLLSFRGDWSIQGNCIMALDGATRATAAPLAIFDTAAITVIQNNSVYGFSGSGIEDWGLRSTYQGNTWDSGGADASNGAIVFQRQNNKVVILTDEQVIRCSAAFGWRAAAGAGESYQAGRVRMATQTNLHKVIAGGTIYDLAAEIGYHTTAPAAGYWAAGTRFYYLAPASGALIGGVCTTGGDPATWKDFGAIL